MPGANLEARSTNKASGGSVHWPGSGGSEADSVNNGSLNLPDLDHRTNCWLTSITMPIVNRYCISKHILYIYMSRAGVTQGTTLLHLGGNQIILKAYSLVKPWWKENGRRRLP